MLIFVWALPDAGQELEQWDEIKLAASEAIAALGGTITYYHAVGATKFRTRASASTSFTVWARSSAATPQALGWGGVLPS